MIRELSKRMEILSHHQLISNECIRGIIHTAHYSAKVDIYYKPLTFKSEPPQVASEELWLKDDVDWHFSVEDTR